LPRYIEQIIACLVKTETEKIMSAVDTFCIETVLLILLFDEPSLAPVARGNLLVC
jgi:hypothetical protein